MMFTMDNMDDVMRSDGGTAGTSRKTKTVTYYSRTAFYADGSRKPTEPDGEEDDWVIPLLRRVEKHAKNAQKSRSSDF